MTCAKPAALWFGGYCHADASPCLDDSGVSRGFNAVGSVLCRHARGDAGPSLAHRRSTHLDWLQDRRPWGFRRHTATSIVILVASSSILSIQRRASPASPSTPLRSILARNTSMTL